MKKLFLSLLLTTMVLLTLTGCLEPSQFSKTDGEVIDKKIVEERFGDSYYIVVAYPFEEGDKFIVENVYVEKDEFNNYKPKDKVTLYVNKNGIGQIVK